MSIHGAAWQDSSRLYAEQKALSKQLFFQEKMVGSGSVRLKELQARNGELKSFLSKIETVFSISFSSESVEQRCQNLQVLLPLKSFKCVRFSPVLDSELPTFVFSPLRVVGPITVSGKVITQKQLLHATMLLMKKRCRINEEMLSFMTTLIETVSKENEKMENLFLQLPTVSGSKIIDKRR